MNVERLQPSILTQSSGKDMAHMPHRNIWSKITRVAVYSGLVVLANHRNIAAATANTHLNHRNILSSADPTHTTPPSNGASKLETNPSRPENPFTNKSKNKAGICTLDDFNSANKGLNTIGELVFGAIRGAHVYAQSELNCRYELHEAASMGQMFALPLAEAMRDPQLQQATQNITNELLLSALPQALDTFLNTASESEFKQKMQDLSEVITKGVFKGALSSFSNATELLDNPALQDAMKSLVNTVFEEVFKKIPQVTIYLTLLTVAIVFAATTSLVASVYLYQKLMGGNIMGGTNSMMTHAANDVIQGAIGGAAHANTAAHLNNLAQNASAGAIAGIVDQLKKPENTQVLVDIVAQLIAANTASSTPLNTGHQPPSGNESNNTGKKSTPVMV
jgi:hypothetical protein